MTARVSIFLKQDFTCANFHNKIKSYFLSAGAQWQNQTTIINLTLRSASAKK